ncbi:MAG: DUF4332 domain-containing protein [Chloroflexota bacterium]|nr:DUF4332 domain-containing protein [Chloroflexota bacterium]
MATHYHIDLENFSLDRFRHILETSELLPGRKVLKENIADRFGVLASRDIRNLKELIDALSTRNKIERFSRESGLPEDYLMILRREANSYVPKPVNLKEFPGVNHESLEKLSTAGITNTKHLFEKTTTRNDRENLSRLVNVSPDDLLELAKLSDLVRVAGVGPVFARIILDAGIDTLEMFSNSSPEESFEKVVAVNKEKQYTKIMATLKDVTLCINMAKDLPKVIEYE